jgi:hypothetical protein
MQIIYDSVDMKNLHQPGAGAYPYFRGALLMPSEMVCANHSLAQAMGHWQEWISATQRR